MKHSFSLFLFLGLLNLTFAQDSCSTHFDQLNHGLQFQIGSNFNLISFENYTFSYRYRFDSHSGLRIGVLTSVYKDDYDITEQIDSITVNPPEYNHDYNFKLSVQYLHSISVYKDFSLILGGGPFVSYTERERKSYYLGRTYSTDYREKNKTTGFGLDLLLGVEYSLSDNIILSGEYGFTILKETGDIEDIAYDIYSDPSQNSVSKSSGTVDELRIGGLGVNLGIAVFL
jgi:opacity protein-like surface antigen